MDNAPADAASPGPGETSMIIADWTAGGNFYVWRTVLSFDLSSIPLGATIDTAYLSLWANPTSPSGNVGSPTYGTANAVGVYRVVDAWDTTTECWNTQPGFGYTDGDTLSQSTSNTENYLNVNVTALVKNMLFYEGPYGFMLKHIQETTPYNSMIFYSPYQYAADTSVTPLLVITYTTAPSGILNINNNKAALDIYPNPASAMVNIKVVKGPTEHIALTVSDCVGRTVATKNINENSTQVNVAIDVNDYAKGIYLVKLSNSNGDIVTKKLEVN